VKTAGPT